MIYTYPVNCCDRRWIIPDQPLFYCMSTEHKTREHTTPSCSFPSNVNHVLPRRDHRRGKMNDPPVRTHPRKRAPSLYRRTSPAECIAFVSLRAFTRCNERTLVYTSSGVSLSISPKLPKAGTSRDHRLSYQPIARTWLNPYLPSCIYTTNVESTHCRQRLLRDVGNDRISSAEVHTQ